MKERGRERDRQKKRENEHLAHTWKYLYLHLSRWNWFICLEWALIRCIIHSQTNGKTQHAAEFNERFSRIDFCAFEFPSSAKRTRALTNVMLRRFHEWTLKHYWINFEILNHIRNVFAYCENCGQFDTWGWLMRKLSETKCANSCAIEEKRLYAKVKCFDVLLIPIFFLVHFYFPRTLQ